MNLFARSKLPVASALPVMPGFMTPRLSHDKKWKRRGIYVLLGFLCFFYSFFIILVPMQLKVPLMAPLIVMLLLVIWALPVRDYFPSKITHFLFWAYTITLLLWPNYLAIALPGLPWITAARLFAAPLVIYILVYASTSLPFKEIMKSRLQAVKPLWVLITIFALIQVVSIVAASQPFLVINRVFNNQVMWTGMFFATVWVMRDVKSLERWIIAYAVMTFILGMMAVWEAQLGQVIWANSVPSIFAIDDPSVERILQGSYRLTGQYRVQTTATTPLSFAEMMVLCVPFLFYLMQKYPKPSVILGCLVVDGLIIYGLIQADARLGFVGLIIGHVLYFLFYALDKRRQDRNSLMGAGLVVSIPVFMVLVTLAVLFIGRLRVRVLGGGQHESSNDARIEQMNIAFEKIWASPIFGFGSGEGGPRIGFMNGEGVVTIDSYYLMVMMDYGFVGFLVFYGMLIYSIYVCAKIAMTAKGADTRRMAAVIAIFISEFLVIKSVLAQEANHPLAFMMLGAVATVAYSARTQTADDRQVRPIA